MTDRAELLAALGLAAGDLLEGPLPIQVVATDVAHLMVPVTRSALSRSRPDPGPLAQLAQAHGAEGCYLFTLETSDAAAHAEARFFSPSVGIAEDPATGTAAGPLAAFLVRHGVVDGPRVIIDQGRQTGRPSRLEVTVTRERIELHGRGVVTAEGLVRVK